MNHQDHSAFQVKIVLIGDSSVGKTNLVSRFCKNEFSLEPRVTVGVEFAIKSVQVDDRKIKLQIWDTYGQENFEAITKSFFRGTLGVLLVFDIAKYTTFQSLDKWIQTIKENVEEDAVIMLIGNKSDLIFLREVNYEDALAYAEKKRIIYIETSALDGSNVEQAFRLLITQIYRLFLKYNVLDKTMEERAAKKSVKLHPAEIFDNKKCCN